MKALLIGLVLLSPGIASADPCEGDLPTRSGQTFAGTVRYVGDGDGLCVGSTSNPATWIEVRLSDFDAPELGDPGGREAHRRLRSIAMGQPIRCVAVRGRSGRVIVYDRVVAACRLNGRAIGERLRAAGGREGGS